MEEAVARKAVNDVLRELYKECDESGGLEALDDLSSERVTDALEQSVAGYVYERWLQELGLSIERGEVSEAKAVSLEREMKGFLRATVQLELEDKNVLAIDWAGTEGRQLIDALYLDAYSMLEGEE